MAWSDAARAAALETRRAHAKGNKMLGLGQGVFATRNVIAKAVKAERRKLPMKRYGQSVFLGSLSERNHIAYRTAASKIRTKVIKNGW